MKYMQSGHYYKIITLSLLMFIGCTPPTSLRLHPEFVASPDIAHNVVMLTPRCYVRLIDLSSENKNHSEREAEILSSLVHYVPKILLTQGYNIQLFEDSLHTLQSRETNDSLWQSYYSTLNQLYPDTKVTMKTVADYPARVVIELADFVYGEDNDALLLVSYDGFKRSTGSTVVGVAGGVVLGVLTGVATVPISEGGTLKAALVDASTGNILWHNYVRGQETTIEKLLEKLFAKFPNYNENLSNYISNGEEINHPFRVKQLVKEGAIAPGIGPDEIIVIDGRSFSGKIIDISKKNIMLSHRSTLYIISKKQIQKISMSEKEETVQSLSEMDFKRVNYNSFSERININ